MIYKIRRTRALAHSPLSIQSALGQKNTSYFSPSTLRVFIFFGSIKKIQDAGRMSTRSSYGDTWRPVTESPSTTISLPCRAKPARVDTDKCPYRRDDWFIRIVYFSCLECCELYCRKKLCLVIITVVRLFYWRRVLQSRSLYHELGKHAL